jgi:membrane-bound metal-dependent hydrolase YbcI (DUF457 family)
MPDLLTHTLVGYIIATILSFKYEWLTPPWVTIAMMGTFIPDLTKIKLVVPSYLAEQILGIPFDWFALHTFGGAIVSVLIGTVLVPSEYRKRIFALLAIGAGSHIFLDAFLITTSGYMSPMLWPITSYGFAMPELYLSSDRWPALVAGSLASSVWWIKRNQRTAV